LLALVAGVPLLLSSTLGWPLPKQPPTLAWLRQVLTARITDTAVIDTLAVAAWIAWLYMVGCITVELLVQARGLSRPRRRPSGMGQQLAARLVAGLLLAVPAAQTFTATPAALSRVVATTSAPAATGDHGRTDMHLTTLNLDETAGTAQPACLTPPLPAVAPQRMAHAAENHDSSQATAARHHSDRPQVRYRVQPPDGGHHDTLWDIARRHLGDPLRYREIFALNHGRPQPDGHALTEASLIRPGWILLLPADAHGPGLEPISTDTPEPAGHDQTRGHAPHIAGPSPNAPAAQPGATEQIPTQQPPRRAVDDAPTAAPHEPAQDRAPRPPTTTDHELPQSAPVTLGLGLGALAGLAALVRARRAAQRRRPIGTRPAPVPPPLRQVEASLRADARRAAPVADAVRLAVAIAAQQGDPQTRVVGAVHEPDGAVLLLIDPAQPAPVPFSADPQGWRLDPDQQSFAFGIDDQVDPQPALAPLGRAHAGQVFYDLEPAGMTTIDGRETDVADLLATLCAALAGAGWTGVHLHGPPELITRVGSLEHVTAVADLSDQLTKLRPFVEQVRSETAGAQCVSVAEHRRAGGAQVTTVMVFVGWSGEQLPAELVALALDPTAPVLVVSPGNNTRAGEHWTLAGRTLHVPGLPEPVTVPERAAAADLVPDLLTLSAAAPVVPADDPSCQQILADTPPQSAPAGIDIRVLGPVELVGADAPRRTQLLELLVYLALHRRGAHADQLATGLWSGPAVAAKTVRNRIAEARALVGGAISDGPGWRLADTVSTDWQHFQALAAGSPDQQREALALVRGRPFEGFDDADWIDLEGFRTEIEAAIVDVAVSVAERALADGDPAAAYTAARAGLRASRYDERLYRLAMRAADDEGSTAKVRNLMRELRTVLDIDLAPDDQLQDDTLELFSELIDAARSRQATLRPVLDLAGGQPPATVGPSPAPGR
jgi:DNA-binding SARP family transcriptional activator